MSDVTQPPAGSPSAGAMLRAARQARGLEIDALAQVLKVPERKLISFVFFGLPEIERNLKLDPPLAQRVAMRYRLEPFNAESTEAISRRISLDNVGWTVLLRSAWNRGALPFCSKPSERT